MKKTTHAPVHIPGARITIPANDTRCEHCGTEWPVAVLEALTSKQVRERAVPHGLVPVGWCADEDCQGPCHMIVEAT